MRPVAGLLQRHLGQGLDELTVTTNGSQLARYAQELADCGVRRINVSLDTIDREHFAAVTHEHFQQIFSKADVTAEDVHSNTLAILKGDARLAKYATAA